MRAGGVSRDGLRVGVIGVGRIGASHARTLSELPDVGSLVVADVDVGRAAVVAAELAAGSASVDELLSAALDAVVIATATPGHAPLLRRAAETGVPAFCEKPVAL